MPFSTGKRVEEFNATREAKGTLKHAYIYITYITIKYRQISSQATERIENEIV